MGLISALFRPNTTNVLDILTEQHKQVDELFERLENGEGDRRATFMELANNLAAHAAAEEQAFYPPVMAKETTDKLRESVEEHLSIKRVLADLLAMKLDDDQWKAKLKVMKELVAHHAHKEEEDKLFPQLRKMMSTDELAAIGNDYLVKFEELMAAGAAKQVPSETEAAAELPSPR